MEYLRLAKHTSAPKVSGTTLKTFCYLSVDSAEILPLQSNVYILKPSYLASFYLSAFSVFKNKMRKRREKRRKKRRRGQGMQLRGRALA